MPVSHSREQRDSKKVGAADALLIENPPSATWHCDELTLAVRLAPDQKQAGGSK